MKNFIAFTISLLFCYIGKCEDNSKTQTVVGKGSIGVRICGDTFLEIDEVFQGKPAWNAGLRTGDLILSVDGNEVRDVTFKELIELLKGEAGQPVLISVKTRLEGSLRTFEVIREDISYEFPR